MDTYTPDRREEDWDGYPAERDTETQTQTEAPLPRRARRQFFNRRTAALGALVTCAIGFYAGIRVEKTQLSSSGSGLGSAAGGRGSARAAAFAALAGRGGAGASFGRVAGVKGQTILVTDTSGNTVKVKVSSSTKITKNQSVSRHAIRPGDTVIVTGAAGSGGTTNAATITDSGNRGGGSGSGGVSGSSGGSGSGGGGNSAVGSLFSSGG